MFLNYFFDFCRCSSIQTCKKKECKSSLGDPFRSTEHRPQVSELGMIDIPGVHLEL